MFADFEYKKIEVRHPESDITIVSNDYNIIGNRVILHGHDFSLVDRNSVVKLIGYRDDGIVQMEGVATLSIKKQINVDVEKFGQISDRRDYLKVRTNIEAAIIKAYMANRKGKVFHVDDKIRLRDISIGGICFFSDKVYFIGHRLYIDLNNIAADLIVEAVVLRKRREETGNYKYRYACRFVDLDMAKEREICEYAFKRELINHEKELEKDMNIYDL